MSNYINYYIRRYELMNTLLNINESNIFKDILYELGQIQKNIDQIEKQYGNYYYKLTVERIITNL